MPRTETDPSVVAARRWLAALSLGDPLHHGSLTVFPLTPDSTQGTAPPVPETSPSWPNGNGDGGPSGGPRYALLSDAIEAGTARIEEVSEGGQVPFLGVTNDGRLPILIPEGEVLVGAKQNRVVNLTVLVAAESSFKLPVSCVEQGRWRYRSRHFEPAAFAHPKLRELKMKTAQRSRIAHGIAVADQGAVWDEVEEHLCAFEAPSPTRSMTDAYERVGKKARANRRQIVLPAEACGFLVARGDRAVGVDLFDVPATMSKLWDRIAEAYFVESLLDSEVVSESSSDVAEAFLAGVVERLSCAETQPELGVELEVNEGGTQRMHPPEGDASFPTLTGSALWYEGAICHLSAFSANSTP